MRGVLIDTQGPEIRTGNVEDGGKITMVQGSTIELTTNPVRTQAGCPLQAFRVCLVTCCSRAFAYNFLLFFCFF